MFTIITNKPVAYDSPDHLNPFGSILCNSSNQLFNQKLYQLLDNFSAFIMDLGCAGGLFVADCIRDGYKAIGLEGSDIPAKQNMNEWPRLLNQNLFTCDVTEPFTVQYNGQNVLFDCITSWEMMEHIRKDKLPTVLSNIV